ncbi:MAG: DNA internalization-related competence protein ComEC/Rec2 [Oscillospiraceae bacterium]|nr:DNA internalization-related competence protein ComEC/Rec2 [Oscillospiraceae bacterium]
MRLTSFAVAFGLLWVFCYELWQIRPLGKLDGQLQELALVAIEDGEETDYGYKALCRSGSIRVLAYVNGKEQTIRVGDEIRMTGSLKAANAERDLYYIAKDIDLVAYQKGKVTIAPGEKHLRDLPARFYSTIQSRIQKLFPEDTSPFALALLTGDTSKLSYSLRNQMSLAGISHVVAVSGMHVSLICSLVLTLCFRRRRLAAGLCMVAIWFFGAMLGFSPSVTRAVIMNSVLLIAPMIHREYDSPTALGFALMLLLLNNPFSIASVGLQLSFASVAGILCFTRPIALWLRNLPLGKLFKGRLLQGFYTFLTASAATTLGASLFTMPLSAYYFGTVSLISLVSNVALLPFISVIFSLGYPIVAFSYVLYPAAEAVAGLISYPIRWVLYGVEILARVPYGALYSRSIYVILWLGASCILAVLAWFYRKPALAVLLSLVMVVTVPVLQGIHPEDYRFTMLNVGQGQCLLAEWGDSVLVIDCGGSQPEASGEEASRELLSRGRDTVDALVLTHYDLDHTGGCIQLMERMKVKALYLPDITPEDSQRALILKTAKERDIPIVWVKEEHKLLLDKGTVEIFAPVRTKTENDGLALLLSAGDYDILITGDMPIEGEREFLLSKALPDVEVLVAGHHGSRDSTGYAILSYIRPEQLLISVGRNNHGHPNSEVLDRAAYLGIRVRRTDQDGTIIITR